jgi:voltage-gated potassium channel
MKDIKRRLKIFLIIFLLLTISGTFGFMILEDLSFLEAFYYNIVTMSTVGYGDIHPTKPESRMLAVFLIVLGGATFLGVIANASEILIVNRGNKTRRKKVNMVLGAFFSEIGYKLIYLFSNLDKNIETIRKSLFLDTTWGNSDFSAARNALKAHKYNLKLDALKLKEFNEFLTEKRKFLIGLIENPVLIENEGFSEALLALFHLMDELNSRENFEDLPVSDIKHLSGDFNRAYKHLVLQWLEYLQHIQHHYPYLFSLAARKNPFNPDASPIVLK